MTKFLFLKCYNLGGDIMKRIKSILLPIFLSVLCGAICGKVVYGIYEKELDNEIQGEKLYLVQAGAYSTYDNMVSNTKVNNYVYYEDDDGLFKSIIGITENYDNVVKIKKVYGKDVVISEYYSYDSVLNSKIKEYDKKLFSATEEEEIKKVVLEMLTLYKGNDAKLTQVIS